MGAAAASAEQASGRPGWWSVVVAVVLGYVWAAILLIVAGIVLGEALGLVPTGTAGDAGWDSPLPGPFPPDGPWALAANAVVAAAVIAVAAWATTDVVSRRLEVPVSFPVVLVVLAVTGYAPFLYLEGRLRLSSVFGLLVAAWLVRRFAIGSTGPVRLVEAARARLPETGRARRALVVAAATACGAAGGVAAAYGLTHPLTGGYAVDYGPAPYRIQSVGGTDHYAFAGERGTQALYVFEVENGGLADLRVERVELPAGTGFRVADVYVSGIAWLPGDTTPLPPPGRAIPGRDTRWLVLDLRLAGCGGAPPAPLARIRVHYEVVGRSASMLVPLRPVPLRRC